MCWNPGGVQRRLNYGRTPFTCGKGHLSSAFPTWLSLRFWKANANVPEKVRTIGHCGVFTTSALAEGSSSSKVQSVHFHKLHHTERTHTLLCKSVLCVCKQEGFFHVAGARWQARSTRTSCKYYVPWISIEFNIFRNYILQNLPKV